MSQSPLYISLKQRLYSSTGWLLYGHISRLFLFRRLLMRVFYSPPLWMGYLENCCY